MCSEKDGSSVPNPPSPPADFALPERPEPSNAFEAAFLARLEERDEPPAAEEADWAGPWRLPTFSELMKLRIFLEDLLGVKVDLITEPGLRESVSIV